MLRDIEMIDIKTIVLYKRKAPTPFSEWDWMIVVGQNFFLRGKYDAKN